MKKTFKSIRILAALCLLMVIGYLYLDTYLNNPPKHHPVKKQSYSAQVEKRNQPPDSAALQSWQDYMNSGDRARWRGDIYKAIQYYEIAHDFAVHYIGRYSFQALEAKISVALWHEVEGNFNIAAKACNEIIPGLDKVYGDSDSPHYDLEELLLNKKVCARIYGKACKWSKAERLRREIIMIERRSP